MLVTKVLNNSLILVDDSGVEKIVMAKGIGFRSKTGERVTPDGAEKIFELRKGGTPRAYEELALDIDEVYFELAAEIVRRMGTEAEKKAYGRIFFALADHLSYAVERFEKGLTLQNRLLWEIRTFYPNEFAIGMWAISLANRKLGVELPEEEAGNIAYHLVNARSEILEVKDVMLAVSMLKDILGIIQMKFPSTLERDSIHYSRLLIHLQFFLQRTIEGKMLDNDDDFLLEEYSRRYPDEARCVDTVEKYIESRLKKSISKDEKLYLLVHIARNVNLSCDEKG